MTLCYNALRDIIKLELHRTICGIGLTKSHLTPSNKGVISSGHMGPPPSTLLVLS